jgi:signal peptidase I
MRAFCAVTLTVLSMNEPIAKSAVGRELIDIAKTIGAALVVTLVLRVVVFQPFTIPSDSMESGLVVGDYLVISKWSYGWSRFSLPFAPPLPAGRLFGQAPRRGDVVVFDHVINGPRTAYIKRVIGLPGDRVQVRLSQVYINGAPIPREVLGPGRDPDAPDRLVTRVRESLNGRNWVTLIASPDAPGETTPEFVVPAHNLFVMGDNRDNSLDSRWPAGVGMGFVPIDEVEGRARFVVASWRGGASLWKPWTWFTRFDPSRVFKAL